MKITRLTFDKLALFSATYKDRVSVKTLFKLQVNNFSLKCYLLRIQKCPLNTTYNIIIWDN